MKVLFLYPNRSGQGNIPLNIPLLIAALRADGHEIRLFDLSDYDVFNDKSYESLFFKEAGYDIKRIDQERKQYYSGDEFRSPLKGIELRKSDYRSDAVSLLASFKPDLIAVSCLSMDFRFTTDFLAYLRNYSSTPVVFGGVHTILNADSVIESPVIDFVCTGEGEASLPLLAKALKGDLPLEAVSGIWFKRNGVVTKNSPMNLTNLTTLSYPDFGDFDPIHFYRPFDGKRYKMLNYEFSRGCPFSCSYCVNSALKDKYAGLGRYHRTKDIAQSITEMKYLINRYGFNFVRFWDENFTSFSTRVLEQYAEAYLSEVALPFLIWARVETITEAKVKILKDMGCRTFAMGIESGNQRIRQQVMNRKMSNETIVARINLVKSYGMRTSTYNIIGLPSETRANIFETIELNRQANPDSFSVSILEPYKGTPIRKMCEDAGLDPNYEINDCNSAPHFIPEGMTAQELKGLFRTFQLYVRFPKQKYSEIELAERDDVAYRTLLTEFEAFR